MAHNFLVKNENSEVAVKTLLLIQDEPKQTEVFNFDEPKTYEEPSSARQLSQSEISPMKSTKKSCKRTALSKKVSPKICEIDNITTEEGCTQSIKNQLKQKIEETEKHILKK